MINSNILQTQISLFKNKYKMKTGFSNRMKDVFTFVREEVIRLDIVP